MERKGVDNLHPRQETNDAPTLHSSQILAPIDRSIPSLPASSSDSAVSMLSRIDVYGAGNPEKRINNNIKKEISHNINQKIIGIMNSKHVEIAFGVIPTQEVAHAIMQEAENQRQIASATTSTGQSKQLENTLRSSMAENMLHNPDVHKKLALDVAKKFKEYYINIDVNNVSVELYRYMSKYSSHQSEGEFTAMLKNDDFSFIDNSFSIQQYGIQNNQPSEFSFPNVSNLKQFTKDFESQHNTQDFAASFLGLGDHDLADAPLTDSEIGQLRRKHFGVLCNKDRTTRFNDVMKTLPQYGKNVAHEIVNGKTTKDEWNKLESTKDETTKIQVQRVKKALRSENQKSNDKVVRHT